jgi:carbamoyltransferase
MDKFNSPERTISIYGSHDASVTYVDKNKNLRIAEYERFVNKRYAMFSNRFDHREDMGTNNESRLSFLKYIKNNLFDENIEEILYLELSKEDIELILNFFPNAKFTEIGHHFSHVCSGFYPSRFNSSLIFSVDGGGIDNGYISTTKVYINNGQSFELLERPNIDFGNPYSGIGYLISEISPSPSPEDVIHSLSYSGKIMGLCAYGNIIKDWVPYFEEYYFTNNLNELCSKLKIRYGYNTCSGQLSYDLAATSQYVFEEKMWSLILPYVKKYNLNVVLVGGCALNVLFNQKLKKYLNEFKLDLYVPPNPNDCGLSYGMFLSKFPKFSDKEIAYSGIEILDEDNIEKYNDEFLSEDLTPKLIVDYLKIGKIIGIINDYSEVGPRALGNRSIICDPSFPNMKDIINSKVKFREWFRPFAPVCLEEDMSKYFEDSFSSPYMSYAPIVKEEYKKQLNSITHIDGSARLQTTNEIQHELFSNILIELKKNEHIPVILNTSFNIKGRPILTTLSDAFYVLENTEMDYLIHKNKIYSKIKK